MQELVKWFDQFLDWLQNSKNGIDEDGTANNHATQYDAQVASYALFVGKPEIARKVLTAVGPRRIDTQIQPDGSQPHELKRTKSWDYSCANIRNLTRLAELGRHVDVDLWTYEKDGKSILKTIDYLLPYVMDQKEWERKQIKEFDPKRLLVSLLQAIPYDDSDRYANASKKLMAEYRLENLLYAQPGNKD
jgi:hypothetical protein